MKYTKKPVTIDAFQWKEGLENTPVWLLQAEHEGVIDRNDKNELVIKTLEGVMVVSENDYIIKGVKGELYPCKPDIFDDTYHKSIDRENRFSDFQLACKPLVDYLNMWGTPHDTAIVTQANCEHLCGELSCVNKLID